MVRQQEKGDWRSAMEMSTAQSAMISGDCLMQGWPVEIWDSLMQVMIIATNCHLYHDEVLGGQENPQGQGDGIFAMKLVLLWELSHNLLSNTYSIYILYSLNIFLHCLISTKQCGD